MPEIAKNRVLGLGDVCLCVGGWEWGVFSNQATKELRPSVYGQCVL